MTINDRWHSLVLTLVHTNLPMKDVRSQRRFLFVTFLAVKDPVFSCALNLCVFL